MISLSTIAGFFIANLGLVCGYVLTRCLPEEKSDVEKMFSIKTPFLFVISAGVIASFYPTPLTAGLFFVFLLITGSSIAELRKIVLLSTCSMAAFFVPYTIRLML